MMQNRMPIQKWHLPTSSQHTTHNHAYTIMCCIPRQLFHVEQFERFVSLETIKRFSDPDSQLSPVQSHLAVSDARAQFSTELHRELLVQFW